MTGMNRYTGRSISGIENIRQSVEDILTTPVGSRVMRRQYGSLVPELIDQPMNESTLLRTYSASVIAIVRWEPRIKVRSIQRVIEKSVPGRLLLSIDAQTTRGETVTLEVPIA